MVNKLEASVASIDYILDSRRKRHIIGGLLISLSLLFGGLAITTMTLKDEKEKEEPQNDEN